MSGLYVSVYLDGASSPLVRNPCRNMEEAEALKSRIELTFQDRGWAHKVCIEGSEVIPARMVKRVQLTEVIEPQELGGM